MVLQSDKTTIVPPTFALVSPCGYGNLGDAAIQDAMIANIRMRYPDARILGITLNPPDTEGRHGITTFPIRAGERHKRAGAYPTAEKASAMKQAPVSGKGLTGAGLSWIYRIVRTIARSVLPESVRARLRTMCEEGQHLAAAFQWLRAVDTLIFSGGGQLDDSWGGPSGHPWALIKWTLLAKLRNARVLILSVGYGSLESWWSRRFVRLALSMADYRSYRDAGSRDLMRRAGFAGVDPVVPDLAYSRPSEYQRGPIGGSIRTVGICPMAYCDPRGWFKHDRRAYESYLERLAQVAVWLIQTQRRLVFFVSGGADHRVADEVIARVSSRVAPSQHAQMRLAPVVTVDGFLEQAAAVDVVVGSRLHALLLSHLAGTPTIAISYERKVDALMAEMEQDAYALSIDALTLPDFRRVFEALEGAWQTARDRLRAKRTEYRGLLQRQYDLVLCDGSPTMSRAEQGELSPCRKHASRLSATKKHSCKASLYGPVD